MIAQPAAVMDTALHVNHARHVTTNGKSANVYIVETSFGTLEKNMAGLRDCDKKHFPLNDSKAVVELFVNQLENDFEPDLTLLSTVAGIVESNILVKGECPVSSDNGRDSGSSRIVELEIVQQTYDKFGSLIKDNVKLQDGDNRVTTHDVVKKVSDTVWNYLSRSYHKEKSHLQSVYSFIKGTDSTK